MNPGWGEWKLYPKDTAHVPSQNRPVALGTGCLVLEIDPELGLAGSGCSGGMGEGQVGTYEEGNGLFI